MCAAFLAYAAAQAALDMVHEKADARLRAMFSQGHRMQFGLVSAGGAMGLHHDGVALKIGDGAQANR